jgi:phosphonate degradation associated HDIG domain protein
MTNPTLLEPLVAIYRDKSWRRYGLSRVTQLEHALQGGLLAEQAGRPAHLIVATLLHDVGHMIHDLGESPAAEGVDDRHQRLGADFLSQWFGLDVTTPVRLHVAAKRYLCHAEAGYEAGLSDDSVRSLRLQGGAMNAAEAERFRDTRGFEDAVELRRYDDLAKVAGLPTPAFDHFLPYLMRCTTAR